MSDDLVPDDLWERIAPLLPPRPPRHHRYPGRLPVDDRAALRGIVYVLRKKVSWRDVLAERTVGKGAQVWRARTATSDAWFCWLLRPVRRDLDDLQLVGCGELVEELRVAVRGLLGIQGLLGGGGDRSHLRCGAPGRRASDEDMGATVVEAPLVEACRVAAHGLNSCSMWDRRR
ncbi:transposase [Streptomyces sp. NPDC090303]|uniref:transposase n=1 Tax=Streptomyces sp. NPDC090303 TaxID=3365960 RepID=UPI00382A016E